jgi:phosphonopyruvate decarboxylase
MVHPERFYQHLSGKGIEFYTGVPDSLIKSLLLYFQQNIDSSKHIIAANEGLAVALAAGYHISTGKLPLVYMQNSGLGNAINSLTSLTDPEVYSIPMLLLIGWRGMPGKNDEPQHIKMGRITDKILDVLEIPYFILDEDQEKTFLVTDEAIHLASDQQQPVALLVPGEILEDSSKQFTGSEYLLTREYVLQQLTNRFNNEIIVSTTGKASRELMEANMRRTNPIEKTFLAVGSMGLANHVALGIDIHSPDRVVMIDGDGAVLMHMGSLTSIAGLSKESFVHIVINNGSHESVGGQPTMGFEIDFCTIARGCGYEKIIFIRNEEQLIKWLSSDYHSNEKQFVEIRVNSTSRSDLTRPGNSPLLRKEELMKALHRK